MPEIPEEAKRQALDAVESIRGMVQGEGVAENGGFAKDRSSYPSLVEHAPNVVDAYDSQGMATAREQQRTGAIERAAGQQREGREI